MLNRGIAIGVASFALVLVVGGCAAKRTAAWEVKSPTAPAAAAGSAESATALVKEGDDHWAKRQDRAELEAAIASWLKATEADAANAETWAKLARGAYLLADGWLAFDGEAVRDRFMQTHEQGMSYAERGMVLLSPEFKAKVEAGAKVEEAASALSKEGLHVLYWWTANLGKWSNANGFSTVLKNKNRIKSNIELLLKQDPEFFYGGADRYLMVIYAKAPSIAGGDLKKSDAHYQATLKIAPNYLGSKVLWAEFYATKAGDRDGFKRELEWVAAQADDVIPDLLPEAQIEKKKAKRLLEAIEEKF